MAKASNGVEKLWKVSAGWVGRMSITDRQTERRQTDGRQHIANVREFTFAKKHTDTLQLQHLQQQVDQYNTEQCQLQTTDPCHTTNGKYIALDIDGHCVIVATRSPLLKRVHHFISHSAQLAFLPVETWTSTTCGSSSWSYSVVGVSYHRERTGGFISRALELHNSLLDSAGFFPAMTGRSCSVHNWWLSS